MYGLPCKSLKPVHTYPGAYELHAQKDGEGASDYVTDVCILSMLAKLYTASLTPVQPLCSCDMHADQPNISLTYIIMLTYDMYTCEDIIIPKHISCPKGGKGAFDCYIPYLCK